MRTLILKLHISVDGCVGGPHGEVNRVFKSQSGVATDWIVAGLGQAGVHIMGRRTFFDMAAYRPYPTEPYAPAMTKRGNHVPNAAIRFRNLGAAKSRNTRSFRGTSFASLCTRCTGSSGGSKPRKMRVSLRARIASAA